jgi:hypothetical protein
LTACPDREVLVYREPPESSTPTTTPSEGKNGRLPFRTSEICDRLDNDQNGIVDDIPASVCYSGDFETLRFGACRAGVTRCLPSGAFCEGEILPAKEVCNGIDDDCNGIVDDGLEPAPKEAVLIIDTSASMDDKLPLVKDAVALLEEIPDTTWSVVGAPAYDYSKTPQSVKTYLRNGTLTEAKAQVRRFSPSGSGDEPTLDALNENLLPDNPHRVVLLFTDEEPQSYDGTGRDVAQILRQLQLTKATLHIWTLPGPAWNQWLPLGLPTGIYQNPPDMRDLITSVIAHSTCSDIP